MSGLADFSDNDLEVLDAYGEASEMSYVAETDAPYADDSIDYTTVDEYGADENVTQGDEPADEQTLTVAVADVAHDTAAEAPAQDDTEVSGPNVSEIALTETEHAEADAPTEAPTEIAEAEADDAGQVHAEPVVLVSHGSVEVMAEPPLWCITGSPWDPSSPTYDPSLSLPQSQWEPQIFVFDPLPLPEDAHWDPCPAPAPPFPVTEPLVLGLDFDFWLGPCGPCQGRTPEIPAITDTVGLSYYASVEPELASTAQDFDFGV